MKDHTRNNLDEARTDQSTDRRPYSPPALKRHEKLPVITAGSIAKSQWQFSGDNEYQET